MTTDARTEGRGEVEAGAEADVPVISFPSDPADTPRAAKVLPGTAALFAVAALIACYSGVRMPDLWAVTLQTVSLQDGFRHRFLVGTVLQPIAALFGYRYGFYVVVSFLVIAALLAILGAAALKTRLVSRRVLILAWLLLPTGTFLFNEAGFLDQFLYLVLFAALWLRHRSRPVAATALMAVTPFIHEISALMLFPVFAFAVIGTEPFRRALALLAPIVVTTAAVTLAFPASAAGAGERATRRASAAGWSPRQDVYALYQGSTTPSWHGYAPSVMLQRTIPAAVLAVAAFWLLTLLDGRSGALRRRLTGAAAIGAPALLCFAGWDWNRWCFFSISGFFIVAWLWLGDPGREPLQEFRPPQWALFVVAVLVVTHLDVLYFGWFQPRPLSWTAFHQLVRDVRTGRFFTIPFN